MKALFVFFALALCLPSLARASAYDDRVALGQERQDQEYDALKVQKTAQLEAKMPQFLLQTVNRQFGGLAAGTALPSVQTQAMDSFFNLVVLFYNFDDFTTRRGAICRAWGSGRCDALSHRCSIDQKVSCADASGNVKESAWKTILF